MSWWKYGAMGICALALGACGDDGGTGGGGEGGGAGEGGSGEVSLDPGPGDFAADFETSSAFFTAMSAPELGTSPHGTQQTWYSKNIQPVIDAASISAPEGTVAIKRFDMDSDGTDDGLAVMIKKEPGYDAANGDWYYDMRMLDGTVMSDPPPGPTPMCIECHAGASATDYLLGTKLR